MLEKLVPGDRVMKVPTLHDDPKALISYGSCGVVSEGEGTFPYQDITTKEEHIGYGCLVLFDNHYSSHPTRCWFMNREQLMKISPDEDLIHEQEQQKIDDLNMEIKRVREELKTAPERWSQSRKS